MVISLIKTCHPQNTTTSKAITSATGKMATAMDAKTVDSQMSMIMQLTEQVSILQLMYNKINSKLDKLIEFMAQSANTATPNQSKCKAARDNCGSPGQAT